LLFYRHSVFFVGAVLLHFLALLARAQENPAAEAEKLSKTMIDLYQKGDSSPRSSWPSRVTEIFKGLTARIARNTRPA